VLSELPEEWADRATAWSRILRAREAGAKEAVPPDRNDEYAFYQLLLAAWPPDLLVQSPSRELEDFRRRIEGAMVKTMREAKVHTTWAAPNAAYEEAVIAFVRRALDVSRSNPFLETFSEFCGRVAGLGVANSLVQTALKLTVPGVPDIYQGAELWDFSLVDPDNRRPVDYARRRALLGCLESSQPPSAEEVEGLFENWSDGRIKLLMIRNLLRLRGQHPDLFEGGSYEPFAASGPAADRICAFLRRANGATLLVLCLLYPARGLTGLAATSIALPGGVRDSQWNSLCGAEKLVTANSALPVQALLGKFPVAVLFNKAEAGNPIR
jgi:(1->4)-alpha-D-glucan 1-alpha-D-glucosylmutase